MTRNTAAAIIRAGVFLLLGAAFEGHAAERYYTVLASFPAADSAQRSIAGLEERTELALSVLEVELEEGTHYRVAAGPFDTYNTAQEALQNAQTKGIDAWIASVEDADAPDVAGAVDPPPSDPSPVSSEISPAASPTPAAAPTDIGRDVTGERILVRRGIPADLNRGVRPRVRPGVTRSRSRAAPGSGAPVLPPLPSEPANRISQLAEFRLADIRLTSDLLQDEIEPLISPFRNRTTSTEALLALKNRINQLFVSKGYINSGVVIPDQEIVDGVLAFETIVGQVSEVRVESRLRDSYVTRRLHLTAPFNLESLQQSLKLLEKNPLVERIHARVLPGSRLGEAAIDLKVDTTKFYRVGLRAGNNRSPSVGSENGELFLQAENLTSLGDTLKLVGSVTRGLNSHSVEFSIPFNARDHRLTLHHSVNDATIVEEPFDEIDIDSITESLGIALTFPLYRTTNAEFAMELSLEKRRNFTRLLGQPFSFSEGAINGESRASPARLAFSWVSQGLSQSLAGRFVYSRGTGQQDPTTNPTPPDGDFTSYLAQFQLSRQLTDRVHVTAKLLGQKAPDALLAMERMAVGGADTVRGYRQNQLVRDNVYLAQVEGRYRFETERNRVEFVAFFDWGSGKNELAESRRDTISSVGAGISLRTPRGLSAEVFFGHALKDVEVVERDLQDDGVHFNLTYVYRF